MQEALPGLRRPERIFPVSPNLTGEVGYNPQFALDEATGLYVRTDTEAVNFGERINRTPDDSFTLRWWQEWSQDAWKIRHGTPEASIRFVDKLEEEYLELGEELRRAVSKGAVDPELREKIITETGDNLWCINAAASNTGVSVEESYRAYLRELGAGMRVLVDGRPTLPKWHHTAMAQVTQGRLLTDHDVDNFFDAGYVPQPSTHMHLDPDDFEPLSPRDVLHDWNLYRILPRVVANLSLYYYQINEDLSSREEPAPYDADQNHQNMQMVIAESMIRTLYAARVFTGAKTGEIVRKNYQKLTGRIALGLVDKTDGERPMHLR